MAANLTPFPPPSVVRSSGHQKSDSQQKNWWTPLFGWSSEPDYINSVNTDLTNNSSFPARSNADSESDLDHRRVRSRKSPVNFTDQKARKLRMLTTETASFHDAMYHSAIASRFASDFSDRSDL
ncbi:hypothetical protein L1987_28170 [Smallanthus sonchifolius]|uniref:Uncharacterized protein n=1 Tax=Smallanthus sonchifolius TaxID=185202 RepID=A0ACB9ICR9_9ASTR|nr:hypothetical protein L1987_28170 [Smallanthus sonchifolius]